MIYYVDFDGGSDAANGTITATPWKHCPGDPNATGVPAAATLVPGDRVRFKGGVRYRGEITVNFDGTSGSPISYRGDEWGTGLAIMDGSQVIASPTWTQCTSQADAQGNPNWQKIFRTPLPSGLTNCLPQMIMDGTTFMGFAQAPEPSDPIFFERIDTEWYVTPPADVTQTSLTNTTVFVNASADYYDECFLLLWVQGNSIETLPILTYTPGTHTITFSASHPPFTDRDGYFSIVGHPADIYEGSYAVSVADSRLYIWPPGDVDPTAHVFSFGSLGGAFSVRAHTYVIIEGFQCLGYFQGLNVPGELGYFAFISANTANECDGCEVNNNEVFFMRSLAATAVIHLGQGDFQSILGNICHDNTYGRGIATFDCGNMTIQGNVCYRFNGTGIFATTNRDTLIKNNTITDVIGIHGNAISPYTNSQNVRVTANRIKNVNTLITYETSSNLQVDNNEINANGLDQRCLDNGGMSGYVRWLNNTLVNNPNGTSWIIGSSPLATYVVKNNVISGGGVVGNNNAYTELAFYQEPNGSPPPYPNSYGYVPGPGDIMTTTDAALFVSSTDLRLKAGSPAIGAGEDLSAYFTTDITGATRGVPWDIGAYAYTTTPPPPVTGTGILTSQGFLLRAETGRNVLKDV